MTAPARRLHFGLEILEHHFDKSNVLDLVEENLARLGVEEILFWGANRILDEAVEVPEYPKYNGGGDKQVAGRFRAWLRRLQKRGVRLVADGREPHLDPSFFEAYPEARRIDNGMLWDFLEKRIGAVFRMAPELDRVESFPWETWLLSSDNFFEGLHWSDEGRGWVGGQYYEPADYLAEMIAAFARGAAAAGKEYGQKCFFTHPWQERLLIEAVGRVPLELPFRLSTQSQCGDFNPFNPPPAIVRENRARPLTMYFDCYGEYLGQSQVPYCNPEGFAARVRHAMAHSATFDTIRARINFADVYNAEHSTKHLFGKPNEINLVALARLAKDPATPVEEIWRDWAAERYGKKGCEAAVSALRRTADIVKLGSFFHGLAFPAHSQIPTLARLDTWLPRELKDAEGLRPEQVEQLSAARAFVHDPTEDTVADLARYQAMAQHLCELSLGDLRSAGTDLPADRKEELVRTFEFTALWLHLYRLIGETVMRLRFRPERATARNSGRLEELQSDLMRLAERADALGYDKFVIVNGPAIRALVEDVRARLARARDTNIRP